jgi:hypothetical protein
MAQCARDRQRQATTAEAMAKSTRRPLHYRVGTVVRTSARHMDVACLDGGVVAIRLAARTMFTLAGLRLSGVDVLRPGLEVRVASVDSSRGMTAVLVELRARGPGPRKGVCPAFLPVSLEERRP